MPIACARGSLMAEVGRVDDCGAFNVLSLCSGGMGLDLGVELAVPGARVVCGVEWEAFACGYMAAAMRAGAVASFPVWSDLRTFDGAAWRGVVDCVTAGYPCQPFSNAGKRRGADDPRHLWPHVARVIGECGPRFVFLENVAGHLRLDMREVLCDLHALGYRTAAGLFTAEEVGAPHRRERVFILADAGRERAERWADGGGESGAARSSQGKAWERQRGGADDCDRRFDVGDAAGNGCALDTKRQYRAEEEKGRLPELGAGSGGFPLFPPGPGERERWRGVPAALEPAVRGVADGVAAGGDRAGWLRLLGNGVVPLAAAHAFCALLAELQIGTDA